MTDRKLRPESLMMSHGYKPELSQGAVKCPIFQTSTFVFQKAEDGKAFFEVAYGLREQGETEELGLIYSRLNNPDLEILEDRLSLWDGAGDCAVFESGMSAITTTLLEFLSPGDVLLFSNPIYGGTDHFIKQTLTRFGVEVIGFYPWEQDRLEELVRKSGKADRLRMIYVETPANPTNILIDVAACSRLAKQLGRADKPVIVAVDNTYMGPLWQHPLAHGADLVLYSATKYIGGHSDVIAGACLGSKELIARVKGMRTFLGCMAGPWTGWLLLRSLETLKPRMETQARNAAQVAAFLKGHPKVKKVHYLGFLDTPEQQAIFDAQCLSAGAMLAFDIQGGEAEAFRFLNALKLVKLAVSLGSTESLAEHPATMTHVGVDPVEREKLGITGGLVRLSVGVEHPEDLIWDLEQALEAV
ncbi:MAG: cystathionine gamma-synthase family protein [Bacteroidetes bacterium]|nr:cystathionine gamma-synthase family protein [Bacteroidota bacterium]MBS1941107.1 cystathionine gamma-synthase family protein [Bacteroidota bacterium]